MFPIDGHLTLEIQTLIRDATPLQRSDIYQTDDDFVIKLMTSLISRLRRLPDKKNFGG